MKILVWVCECCKHPCLLQFYGLWPYKRPGVCVRDCTVETDLWILKKLEEKDILEYFIKGNEKWKRITVINKIIKWSNYMLSLSPKFHSNFPNRKEECFSFGVDYVFEHTPGLDLSLVEIENIKRYYIRYK